MKKIRYFTLFFLTLCSALFAGGKTVAAYVYYEKVFTREISKDVIYTEFKQVTDLGLRDVYVLKVPTKDPDIKIGAVYSSKDLYFKENVVDLLNAEGAIAGVNGDYFNVAGDYSPPQGIMFKEGELIAADALNNSEKNDFAGFLLPYDGNPFIQYIKSDAAFLINGEEVIDVYYYNKTMDLTYPVCVDSKAYDNTGAIDALFPGAGKIVVKDGVVAEITREPFVKVPQNGFVILISPESSEYMLSLVSAGDKAEFELRSNADLESVYTVIGGGGRIITDGVALEDGGFVAPGRHPRTALGITQDKNYILLVVVDGRNHSIGTSHYELAAILERLGAYNAFHLDGGGSSTMAAKLPAESRAELKNTPTYGAMRNVVNALGVFNYSQKDKPESVEIIFPAGKIIAGAGTPYRVAAFDEYKNSLEVSSVQLSSTDPGGVFKDGMFFPSIEGEIEITAQTPAGIAKTTVEAFALKQILPSYTKIHILPGESVTLDFNGKCSDGTNRYIYSQVDLEIAGDLGSIAGNVFTAETEGAGYIKAEAPGAVYYIETIVGNAAAAPVPQSSVFADPFSNAAGAPVLSVVGDLSLSVPQKPADYVQNQNKLLADLAGGFSLLGGEYDGQTDILRWGPYYSFINYDNFSLVYATAANGNFFNSNPEFWNIENDILTKGQKNIIIQTDRIGGGVGKEFDLLHELLAGFKDKNIYVLSTSGYYNSVEVKDNVRYINIGGLYRNDSSINPDFRILKFVLTGEDLYYRFEAV